MCHFHSYRTFGRSDFIQAFTMLPVLLVDFWFVIIRFDWFDRHFDAQLYLQYQPQIPNLCDAITILEMFDPLFGLKYITDLNLIKYIRREWFTNTELNDNHKVYLILVGFFFFNRINIVKKKIHTDKLEAQTKHHQMKRIKKNSSNLNWILWHCFFFRLKTVSLSLHELSFAQQRWHFCVNCLLTIAFWLTDWLSFWALC